MSIAVLFTPTQLNTTQYTETLRRLEAAGLGAPHGRHYHVCFGSGEQLRVLDVWDSQETLESFATSLGPIVASVGGDATQPDVQPVQNIIDAQTPALGTAGAAQPSEEVTRVFLEYLDVIRRGDAAALEQLIGQDVTVIGTDPAEWWTGHDDATRAFRIQLEEMGGGFPIRASDPRGFALGDVGWACDQPVLTLPDGETSFRLTTVFCRENGRWRIVQSHASIGIANETALGRELTV